MKDEKIVCPNKKEITIRIYDTCDYVLSFIKEPGCKLYLVAFDGDIIHCNNSKQYAKLYTNTNDAFAAVYLAKKLYDLDFSVEKYLKE